MVGAYQDREGKIGSAYIYRKGGSEWSLEQKLAPSDEQIVNFGMAVAIKGDIIAVGDRAYGAYVNVNNDGPKRKGAVWLYEYDSLSKNWVQLGTAITNEDCDNFFGVSLAFSYDGGLLVGCALDDNNAGSVYYYEPSHTGYSFRQKIVAMDRERGDMFGNMEQVSTHSNVMLVGTEKGNAYFFLRTDGVWVEEMKIESPDKTRDYRYADRVALSENNVLISSRYNAYFYELVEGKSTGSCMMQMDEGPLLGTTCTICSPSMAIDGDSAVLSKNKESIQFISGDNLSSFDADHIISEVAISGNRAVAGSPKDGTVRVFQKNFEVWLESAKLSPGVFHFGTAVGVDGDIILVGAYDYTIHNGSAYIFRHNENSWELESSLLPDDASLKGFGQAVSVVNDTVAVSDRAYKGSTWTGAVFLYTYERSSKSWIRFNQTIFNEDCDGMFGSSIALNTDGSLMVGCPADDGNTGAVYYYALSSDSPRYILQQKIKVIDGMPNDNVGDSNRIAVDEDILVVGRYKETNGAVHVFTKKKGAWIEVHTIDAPPEIDGFGLKVALSGNRILVSSLYNVYSYTLETCR